MTIRFRTQICSSIAVAAVTLAVAAPNAFGATSTGTTITIPKSLANFHEPGSTGYVPASALVTTTAAAEGGLDWASALIGLGVGIGMAVASAGGLLAVRRRRTLAHL